MPSSRMDGAIPPLPQMPSWHAEGNIACHLVVPTRTHLPHVTVEHLAVMPFIWKVMGFKLGMETNYPDWLFLWLSSRPVGKCLDTELCVVCSFRPWLLPSTSFPVHYLLVFVTFSAVYCHLLSAPLFKYRSVTSFATSFELLLVHKIVDWPDCRKKEVKGGFSPLILYYLSCPRSPSVPFFPSPPPSPLSLHSIPSFKYKYSIMFM